MAKQATAADFGLRELDALKFDPRTMTIDGCKCNACWIWKTKPTNRRFWREQPKEC